MNEEINQQAEEKKKMCTMENWFCNYKLFGNTIECSYKNYCDFQLPRDSRVYIKRTVE